MVRRSKRGAHRQPTNGGAPNLRCDLPINADDNLASGPRYPAIEEADSAVKAEGGGEREIDGSYNSVSIVDNSEIGDVGSPDLKRIKPKNAIYLPENIGGWWIGPMETFVFDLMNDESESKRELKFPWSRLWEFRRLSMLGITFVLLSSLLLRILLLYVGSS